MSSQIPPLIIALAFFGIICVAELYKAIRQKIRRRQEEAASSPHEGEESTWDELTRQHRPIMSSDPVSFSPGPYERLAAISAPYALCHQDPWDHLDSSDPESEREMLARDWGVHSRIGLLTQIFQLIMFGHRSDFDEERARWTNTSLAEAERYELRGAAESSEDAAETLWRLERMRNNDRGIRNVDFAAWDMVRAAMLTRYGTALGWLTEAEAWDTLALLDRALRERYQSWTQVWESFRLTRWYWYSEGDEEEHFNDLHDLNRSLLLLGPDGPWKLIPWEIPVPESSLMILDDLVNAGVASPLSTGERARATQWERWVDDQVIARVRRSQQFGLYHERHHRFTKNL
ncbi:DUF1266 domain-containing protein [Actinomyces viscosus]|uniref:DUF1266 domain-containing protein n=1 Tax=Actinomyces viscosus TaxID=1656 RepID=UPI0028ED6985|nr:DUF1266 domain-containing protein [Actinomyces viscosus]